jgi:hypothetical protein
MPLPDKYKERGSMMLSAFGRALGFREGGRIILPDGLKYSRGFANIPDRALTMPQVGFRRGGRVMRGSAAMKKKMAKLRAMKKQRV